MLRAKNILTLTVILSCIFGLNSEAFAKKKTAKEKASEVNWKNEKIVVYGQGAPNLKMAVDPVQARLGAERVAKADAYRQLLEAVKAVNVETNITVNQKVKKDQSIQLSIRGKIRGARVIDKAYYDDGGVEITMEARLWDLLHPAFPGKEETKIESLKGKKKKYGSLIVEVPKELSKTGFSYAGIPTIQDKENRVIFGSGYFDKNTVKKPVNYLNSVNLAKGKTKGDSPYLIKALGIGKSGEILITKGDAEVLLSKDYDRTFLSEGKIFIVVSEKEVKK